MEAAGLGIFMISAGIFTTLFEYRGSPVNHLIVSAFARRSLVGVAMGLTATALIYSPWGQQSGAHYNPAVTLTFLRLGRVRPWDAFFYVGAQFLGGLTGVLLASAALGERFQQPPVSYVVTLPGPSGPGIAFLAEGLISFGMMSTILIFSNTKKLARYTGLFAGLLVFTFITIEAPLSGMSMNPARSMASAAPAGDWAILWIYLTGPVLGMLVAADVNRLVRGASSVFCAKLHHETPRRCIFCASRNSPLLFLLGAITILSGTCMSTRAC